MTVEKLALGLGLWAEISNRIIGAHGRNGQNLLDRLTQLPVKGSRATRTLGSYVSRDGIPVCIRLQFAQEPDNLRQTLLHEIAHFCDQQSRPVGQQYRQSHGLSWQYWAKVLGTAPTRCGSSENLRRLYQQRVKLIAVCQRCGAQLHRARRLNRRRNYLHLNCGGRLQLF